MLTVALVTLLILLQYTYFTLRAGLARGKDTVKAPAVSGDETFERRLRVQLNTLEQLAVTLPAMWVCAYYFRADVAAIFGTVFLIGRFIYSSSYAIEPSKRGAGFIIGFLANMALVLCSLWGVITKLV